MLRFGKIQKQPVGFPGLLLQKITNGKSCVPEENFISHNVKTSLERKLKLVNVFFMRTFSRNCLQHTDRTYEKESFIKWV